MSPPVGESRIQGGGSGVVCIRPQEGNRGILRKRVEEAMETTSEKFKYDQILWQKIRDMVPRRQQSKK